MKFDLFKEKMDKKAYLDLEKELVDKKDDMSKYQLGIVYSCQEETKEKAITIFKELIEKNFNRSYIYIFLAENTFEFSERVNIVKCGLSLFPDSESLNRLLLTITSDYLEGEKAYKVLHAKKCLINYDYLAMASLFFDAGNYKKANEMLEKIDISKQNAYTKNRIEILKNVCYYYLNKGIKIKNLRKYKIGNEKEELGYIVYYLEISYYLSNMDYISLTNIITELPYNLNPDIFIEIFADDYSYPCHFILEQFLQSINSKLMCLSELDKSFVNKIKVLNIIRKTQYGYALENISKNEIKNYIKLLEREFEVTKEHEIIETYFNLLIAIGEEELAFEFIFDNYLYSFRYKKIILFDFYEYSLPTIEFIYQKLMSNASIKPGNLKETELIKTLILSLYKNEEYNKICNVYKKYNSNMDFYKAGVLFEAGYSHFEIGDISTSKKIYLAILKQEKNNSSVLNNLGNIYKSEKKYDKALDYFKKAERIKHNDIYVRNIERCNELLEEDKKNKILIIEGKENIRNENIFIINRFETFASHKNRDGNVICSYNDLPEFLNLNSDKANEVLQTLLQKKYIFKNLNHTYDTSKSVYIINSEVEAEILFAKKQDKLVNRIIEKFNSISIKDGVYLNEKCNKIDNMSDITMKSILKRDYCELYIAYKLDNQKSVTILAGGIAELILTYVIKQKNPSMGNKILEYGLEELLTECNNNKYIDNIPINFTKGLKKYRNFVHPGVEIRENKKKIKISDESTSLLWTFVNWLIDYTL